MAALVPGVGHAETLLLALAGLAVVITAGAYN
jgi:hypothetical protein